MAYHFSRGVGAVSWCENPPPNQCIKASEYNAVLEKVKQECAYKKVSGQVRGFSKNGVGIICSSYAFRADVQLSNLDQYDPCYVETLPPCFVPEEPVTPIVPDAPPRMDSPPEDDDDDDNNSFMVGGILAALVVGGIGYTVFKNRKKGKGKKKGRK